MEGDCGMNRVECFRAEEAPHNPGKYFICPVHENFHNRILNSMHDS